MTIPLHTSPVVTRVSRDLSVLLVCALWPLVARLVHADTVTDWNQTAIEVMKVARVAGNPWSRTLAMVHVAMSDLGQMEERHDPASLGQECGIGGTVPERNKVFEDETPWQRPVADSREKLSGAELGLGVPYTPLLDSLERPGIPRRRP